MDLLNWLKKSVNPDIFVLTFAFGLIAPLLAPEEIYAKEIEYVREFLGNRPFVITLMVIAGMLASGALMYYVVLVVRDHPPPFCIFSFKQFVLGLTGVSCGFVVAVTLGLLGMYEAAFNLRIPLVLGALLYLSAGIGGIVAIKRHDE